MVIRFAALADAQALHDIYQYYVDHTTVTFTTDNPPVAYYAEKTASPLYPCLVAEEGGAVLGFAYADRLRSQDAYLWDVELTVYLRPGLPRRGGIGKALYEALLPMLAAQGFRNAYGVITADNAASIAFHQRFGFEEAARFDNMGYKHGAWHGVVWMRKALGTFEGVPEPPAPFPRDALSSQGA